jgi:hypothetical protein
MRLEFFQSVSGSHAVCGVVFSERRGVVQAGAFALRCMSASALNAVNKIISDFLHAWPNSP